MSSREEWLSVLDKAERDIASATDIIFRYRSGLQRWWNRYEIKEARWQHTHALSVKKTCEAELRIIKISEKERNRAAAANRFNSINTMNYYSALLETQEELENANS